MKAILEEAGLTMGHVVKTTVFMADMNDFADMNAFYAEFFTEPYPVWELQQLQQTIVFS